MHRVTSGLFAAVLSAIVLGAPSLHFREQSPPPPALAGRPAPLDRATIEQRVDELLNAHMKVNRFSGAVLIASQGKPLVAQGYGYANGLVRDFRAGRLTPVLSDVTAAEVQDAPARVRDLHQEILTIAETVLPITEDILALVAAYAARKILPAKYQADMLHIALATVARVDALVSWNFKHIVRLEKIRLFNEVNVQLGHQALNILSPREVTTYEGS